MPVSAAEPQAHRLHAKLPPLTPEQADQPRVIIPGALILTREQEDRLMQAIKAGTDELAADNGLRNFSSDNWYATGNNQDRRYLDKQYTAMLAYAMNYKWRPAILGGIFAESNLHVPITRRILQQQIARLIDYFTGTAPYYSFYDVGAEDKDKSDKVDRWVRHVLDDKNNTKADIDAGLERAATTSGAFYHLYYEKRFNYYQRYAEVLVVDKDPYTGADGDFIIKGEDSFVEQTVPMIDPATQQPAVDPGTGQPIAQSTGVMVLKRDMVTPAPAQEVYEKRLIWRRLVVKEGPRAELLEPADFLFPLTAKSLDEASILWHRTSEPLIHIIHRFQQMEGVPPEEMMKRVAMILDRLLPGTNNTPTAASSQPRGDQNENSSTFSNTSTEPQLNTWRVRIQFDVNDDANMEDVFVILTEDGYPIAYDYTANFTPDGRPPFRRLRINPVSNRIHGMGNVELMEPLQIDADLCLNRWNFSQSKSGRVTFWRPELTIEGENDPNLKLNDGGTYRPKPNVKIDDILTYVGLPDLKGMDLKQMLEFLMQISLNMSGVTNVNDAGMVGMDTAKLATGVRNLERSGQELFAKFIADLTPDVRDLLRSLALLAITHLDGPRAFKFFNGDTALLAEINPQDVQGLSLDVNLELTKYRGEQEAMQSQSASTAAREFYALPPIVQARLAPLYKQQLKAYQIKNVEEIIVPLSPMEAMTLQPAPAPGSPAAAPPGGDAPPPKIDVPI